MIPFGATRREKEKTMHLHFTFPLFSNEYCTFRHRVGATENPNVRARPFLRYGEGLIAFVGVCRIESLRWLFSLRKTGWADVKREDSLGIVSLRRDSVFELMRHIRMTLIRHRLEQKIASVYV